ncbi:MAG: hypothetical protein M3Y22_09235 [Pseudomonadota bacterium]|nr:hypothetical protein [Pseudomonadota bacterium]
MVSTNPKGPFVISDNNRRSKRSRVLKSAKIIFGISGSTIDCLVLDETEGGLRVETDVVIQIPENVTIQYRSGAIVPARRRWARGTEIGLEFGLCG